MYVCDAYQIIMKIKIKKNAFILFAFVLIFVQYGNTLRHSYAFDDYMFIVSNEHIAQGWSGISYFFNHIYVADGTVNKIYRPMVFASYIIERELFGKSPSVLHFFNVLYFAILCSVLYAVLRLLMRQISGGTALAMLATILFIVHPVHTEVVANIKSRDEIYSLLGCLYALFFLFKFFYNKKYFYIFCAFLCFLFALFSKINAIAFLAVAVLLIWHLSYKRLLDTVLWKQIALTIAISLVGFMVYKGSHKTIKSTQFEHEVDKTMYKEILANSLTDPKLSAEQRIATAFSLLPRYFQMLTIARPLPYYSGYPYIQPLHLYHLGALAGLLLYLGLFASGIYLFFYRKEEKMLENKQNNGATNTNIALEQTSWRHFLPILGFAILWFLACMSVYSNLIKLAPDTMAVRFLFAPSVAYCLAFVIVLAWLLKADFNAGIFRAKNVRFLSVFGLICLYYGFTTFERNKAWKDSYTLFSTDMPVLENCARAHTYMASELMQQETKKDKQSNAQIFSMDKVNAHYKRAVELFPIYAEAYNFWAKSLIASNKPDEALKVCEQAQQNCPGDIAAIFCMGEALYSGNKHKEAIPYLENAFSKKKNVKKVYDMLSWSYYKTQQQPQAHQILDSALVYFPANSYFLREKGKMFFLDKKMPEAIPYLRQSYDIDPLDLQTLHMLANGYAEIGDTSTGKRFANEFNMLNKK